MVHIVPPEGWQPQVQLAESLDAPQAAADPRPLPPPLPGVSPTELAWRKWLLLAGAPAAGLVLVVGLFSIFFWRDRPHPEPQEVARQPADPALPGRPVPPEKRPDPSPPKFDLRWVPDDTTLLFTLRPSGSPTAPQMDRLVRQLQPRWRQWLDTVLGDLRLTPDDVARLTWASTDPAAPPWPGRGVMRIELRPGYDVDSLELMGKSTQLTLAGQAWPVLSHGAWNNRYGAIDRQTIVIGDQTLLQELAARGQPRMQSPAIERLLPLWTPDADLVLLVDLTAARTADCRLPAAALDLWQAGRQPWHVIWETAEGLGCRLQGSDGSRGDLVLVCGGETAAETVHAAVGQLIAAARAWLSAQVEVLAAAPPADGGAEAANADYVALMEESSAAADAAQWKIADGAVWVWVDGGDGPWALASAAAHGGPAVRAAWLDAAREADEANYRRLLSGLDNYRQTEGQYPGAVSGAARLSAEEQLSWIAAMLPYYGHADWHGQLDPGQPWNSPQNRPIAQQPLPEVINPVLGPAQTEADFPVTHYVGVAGIGADAARLGADDPRAGMFGYGRHTRPEETADGAANTIALLGVTRRLGAWAAGGEPSVRALTEPPYVDGPDGFGSGQPNGMLAGMADGSVRFISKDVDPRVLEQLATINGDQAAAAVAEGPDHVAPQPGPDEPDPELGEPEPAETPDGPQEPPRPAPVDVAARLADKIPELRLHQVPLAEAVDLLADLSTVPVTFDPDAMQHAGVGLRDPVTLQFSQATVGQVLNKLVSDRGLAAVTEDGQILLTLPGELRERLRRRRYTVSDLADDEPAAMADLAALVRTLVVPESWQPRGGRGSVRPVGDALDVLQAEVVHRQILILCEKLRVARGKPLRSRLSAARFTLDTRLARAQAALARPVTANFHEPTPLIEVLAYLGRLAETDLLVDRLALAAAGLSDQSKASVTAQQQPLSEALDGLLQPLGLQYRAIDARTLQVTTRKAEDARLELEFYPVAELLANGRTGPTLVEQIKARLAGPTWSDAGGPAVMHFDPPSNCLIVLQSQPVHAALTRLLAELRN